MRRKIMCAAALACVAFGIPVAAQFAPQYARNLSSYQTTDQACQLDPAGVCQQVVSPGNPLPVTDLTRTPTEIASIESVPVTASTNLCIPTEDRQQIRLTNQTGNDICYRFTSSPDCLCQPGVAGGEACAVLDTDVAPSSTDTSLLYDVTQAWPLNADPRLYLIDSAHTAHAVTDYQDDTVNVTAAVVPAAGAYSIVQAIVDYDAYTPASSGAGTVEAPAAVLACPGAFAGWYIYDVDDAASYEVTGCDDTVDVIFSHSATTVTITGDVFFYTVLESGTSTTVTVGEFHDFSQAWMVNAYADQWLFVDGVVYTIISNTATALILDTLDTPAIAEYFVYRPLIETNCAFGDVRIMVDRQEDIYATADPSWIIAFPVASGNIEVARGEGLAATSPARVAVEPGLEPLDVRDIEMCIPNLAAQPLLLGPCLDTGATTINVPAGRYLIIVTEGDAEIRTGAASFTPGEGVPLREGLRAPYSFDAATDVACADAAEAAEIRFAACL